MLLMGFCLNVHYLYIQEGVLELAVESVYSYVGSGFVLRVDSLLQGLGFGFLEMWLDLSIIVYYGRLLL